MKKNPLILAGACLVLGTFGCQTDEEVQKGYLTPSQTATTSTTETTTTTTDTGSTTSERLPPPSVTEPVASSNSSTSTTTTTSTPDATQSATTTTETTSTETTATETSSASTTTPTPSTSNSSPPALAKNGQQMGGKSGGSGASIKRSDERDSVEKETERPQTVERRAPEASERRRVEEELDASDDVASAKKPASSSTVSSSFNSGTTRVADPTGSVKGVVLNVNPGAKFVVVKFNYRAIPSLGKVLSVTRNGEKVGQIRITKPIKPPHATADILEGDVRRGDVVE